MRQLKLTTFRRSRHQLFMTFSFEELHFSTAYWYDTSIDFYQLEEKYSEKGLQNIYFHIIMFEMNKLCSLKPSHLDLGEFNVYYTAAFEDLWRTIYKGVWAQWRFENDYPDYEGPVINHPIQKTITQPIESQNGAVDILVFSSGGKDSLVCKKLLERANIPFDTMSYSSSIYGTSQKQHEMADAVIDKTNYQHKRKMWIFEDFLDSPILNLHTEYHITTLTAAETPSSIFGSLPYALQHGYQYIGLGHERSADTGQVFWEKTGEDVNHQWGKSFEAEQLINQYIRKYLVRNFQYFSLLKPIHDVVIFNLLQMDGHLAPLTNSCNIAKPWCETCPKCAYVGLGYMAYLDKEIVDTIFKTNMLDNPKNLLAFQQMLGLKDRLPFECLGQTDEVKLAFLICLKKGYTGLAMDVFKEAVLPDLALTPILDKYLKVYEDHLIPESIWQKIAPIMATAVKNGASHFQRWL